MHGSVSHARQLIYASMAERWLDDESARSCHPWFHVPVRAPGIVARALLGAERLADARPGTISVSDLVGAELEIWPFVKLALARHRIRRGSPRAALVELDAAAARNGVGGDHPPVATELILAVVRSEALVALGRCQEAFDTVELAASRVGVAAASHPLLSLPYARAQTYRGRRARETVAAIMTRPGHYSTIDRVEAQLLEMRLALAGGDQDAAVRVGREVERVIVQNRLWWLRANVPAGLGVSVDTDESRAAAAIAVPYPARKALLSLSVREHVVLTELVATSSVDEIARVLVVSQNTVKSQLRSIYRKLDVSSRDAAIAEARRLGLVERG